MSNTTITIEGQEVPVADLAFLVESTRTSCEIHAQSLNDLTSYEDENQRACAAAAFFSANTAVALGKLTIDVIEIGEPTAIKLAIELTGRMNKEHKTFWDAHQRRDTSNLPTAAALYARRVGIQARYNTAVASLKTLTADVAALPCENAHKAAAEIVINLIAKAASEAASSVAFVLGKADAIEVTDAQVKEAVEGAMLQLTWLMGKTEAEAQAIITEKLGTTMEERKAAIIKAQLEPLAPLSHGSRDGALLSADQEMMIVELGVEKVRALLAPVAPVAVVEPAAPAEPVEPVAPAAAVEPVAPAAPAEPTAPAA